MRHATNSQRLSRPTDQKKQLVHGLLRSLVEYDRIQTTFVRAKETQRLADRLVTWGKEDSVHARQQAFRILQDRSLVKRLFDDIAPRFNGVAGGYTRVVRVAVRRGDGATLAQLSFTRIPEIVEPEAAPVATATPAEASSQPTQQAEKAKKGLFEGLRSRLGRKKKPE
jgi:large subunit ribosomal protein L17